MAPSQEILGNSGQLFKEFTANKTPNIHLGPYNLIVRFVAAFFLIGYAVLQFQPLGKMIGCSPQAGDTSVHDSFAVNYCLNRYALRLIPPTPAPTIKTAEEIRIETNKLEIEAWKYLIHQPSDYEVRKNKQKMPHVSPYWRFSSAFMLLYFILMMTCINSWTMMEGNHVMYITDGCRGEMLDTDTEKREAIISDMILYMNNFHKRKNYLGRYILCNIFTLTVLIGITAFYMYLFEWFFDANEGGGYSPLQLIRWTKADNSYRDDPLIRLFPRNMGCDMEYYGPSGTREFKEFKCESPYNNANEFINVAALFLMPVLVFAIILNLIYTILCVVCLTTTCCQNTRFRTAAHPLNNDQRFLLLLVCKNVGYDVQTLLLQKLSTIMTQKTKKTKSTEAATDNLNF